LCTVLALGALAIVQYNKASAQRLKRARVRSNMDSSYRQTSVPDDRC
jgi:hypothetical protein